MTGVSSRAETGHSSGASEFIPILVWGSCCTISNINVVPFQSYDLTTRNPWKYCIGQLITKLQMILSIDWLLISIWWTVFQMHYYIRREILLKITFWFHFVKHATQMWKALAWPRHSTKREVWTHKTNLNPQLFIEVSVPGQDSW
jgi:hypothetical protein